MTFPIRANMEGIGTVARTLIYTTPFRAAERRGGRNQKDLGPRGPWPGAAPLNVPLPPVGSTPLSGSLEWEGRAAEEAA